MDKYKKEIVKNLMRIKAAEAVYPNPGIGYGALCVRDRAPRVRIKSPQVAYMNRVALKTFSYFDTGM